MASSFCPSQNITRYFTVSAKRTLKYRRQTRTTNPVHQSVTYANA